MNSALVGSRSKPHQHVDQQVCSHQLIDFQQLPVWELLQRSRFKSGSWAWIKILRARICHTLEYIYCFLSNFIAHRSSPTHVCLWNIGIKHSWKRALEHVFSHCVIPEGPRCCDVVNVYTCASCSLWHFTLCSPSASWAQLQLAAAQKLAQLASGAIVAKVVHYKNLLSNYGASSHPSSTALIFSQGRGGPSANI